MVKSIHSTEYKTIVSRLREAREYANLTQVEVAFKLKKPQSYISKIERGERRIDVAELIILSKIYRKDLNFFVKK